MSNFRAFIHSMKDEGVDMSHVSISRSYAVLVGLEAYVKTRRRGKRFMRNLIHKKDKILSPEELAKKEEEARDKSESAARERRFLETEREVEERERMSVGGNSRLLEKMHLTRSHRGASIGGEKRTDENFQVPGTGPESAIAPEGTRRE